MFASNGGTRGLNPLDGADGVRFPQCRNDRVEVSEVVHLNVEVERLEAAVAVNELQVDDVGMLGAEYARHGAERSGDVS